MTFAMQKTLTIGFCLVMAGAQAAFALWGPAANPDPFNWVCVGWCLAHGWVAFRHTGQGQVR